MCRANTFLMHNKLVSLNVVQLDVKNSHVCRIRVFCTWNCIEYAKQSFSKLLPLIHTFWLWHKIWFKYVFFFRNGTIPDEVLGVTWLNDTPVGIKDVKQWDWDRWRCGILRARRDGLPEHLHQLPRVPRAAHLPPGLRGQLRQHRRPQSQRNGVVNQLHPHRPSRRRPSSHAWLHTIRPSSLHKHWISYLRVGCIRLLPFHF